MKCLDIYGEPVRTLLCGNFFIKTSIGGFLTLTTVVLALIFTWFIGKDIIYKQKPNSYMQTDIFAKFLHVNISNDNFPFSFTVTDDDNLPLENYESYFTFKLYEIAYQLNNSSSKYELIRKDERQLKNCTYSDFHLISEKQFHDSQLKFTICPTYKNISLYGYWNEPKVTYLQISIEVCQNKTDNKIICNTTNEIKQYIAKKKANVNINFIDSRVVINNNTDPLEHLTKLNYKYFIPEFYKKTIYKIQTQKIFSDDGFIFSEIKNKTFLKVVEESTDILLPDNDELLSFEIYSSNISDSYYRSYIKVQDLIASLGGILKVFMMTFLYLNTIFSRVEKNISIVNEVFVLNKKSTNSGFDDPHFNKIENNYNNSIRYFEKKFIKTDFNDKETDNLSKHIVDFNLRETQKIIPKLEIPQNKSNKKENLNKTFNFGISNLSKRLIKMENFYHKNYLKMQKYSRLRKSDTKINFSFINIMDIICNNYCNKKIPKSLSENFNFYKKAKDSVENYFDFIFMIKKFEEINIIKDCLFTKEQSKMIEIMSRPILSSKHSVLSKKSLRKVEENKELENDGKGFLKRFKDDSINRNLMKKIDENIKNCHV